MAEVARYEMDRAVIVRLQRHAIGPKPLEAEMALVCGMLTDVVEKGGTLTVTATEERLSVVQTNGVDCMTPEQFVELHTGKPRGA